jgi:hypothetical protein
VIKIRANRRYWTGDLFSNGLGHAGSKGRPVLGMSGMTVREYPTGEDVIFDPGLTSVFDSILKKAILFHSMLYNSISYNG